MKCRAVLLSLCTEHELFSFLDRHVRHKPFSCSVAYAHLRDTHTIFTAPYRCPPSTPVLHPRVRMRWSSSWAVLQGVANGLTDKNRRLRKWHRVLGEKVCDMMNLDLVRQRDRWARGVKELREVRHVVPPSPSQLACGHKKMYSVCDPAGTVAEHLLRRELEINIAPLAGGVHPPNQPHGQHVVQK